MLVMNIVMNRKNKIKMNMMSPKKTKYRKQFKGRIHGNAKGNYSLNYGSFGLKALEPGWITSRQIESARVIISRKIRKVGRMWIRIFPHKSITKKPAETRMGKGKGEPEHWVATVKPATILFELGGVTEEQAKVCFSRLAHKLPVKTRMIQRRTA